MTSSVPISPLIITSLDASLNCHVLTVTIHLKYPKKLAITILNGKPRPNPSGPEDPPSGRPHRINWSATIDRIMWSQNPLEAYSHTFSIIWPQGQQVLYFQINALDGINRARSRLPFIAVTRREEVIFYEPWGHTLRENNSWAQSTGPQDVITVTPGSCLITRPNVVGFPQLACSIIGPIGTPLPTNCNTTFYVTIKLSIYEKRPDSYITVGAGSTSSRFAFLKLASPPNSLDNNNEWTQEAPGTGLLIFNPMTIFNFGAALAPNHLVAPPVNARTSTINFVIHTFNLNFPSGAATLEIGPIAVTAAGADAQAFRTDWRTYEPPSPFMPVGTVLNP